MIIDRRIPLALCTLLLCTCVYWRYHSAIYSFEDLANFTTSTRKYAKIWNNKNSVSNSTDSVRKNSINSTGGSYKPWSLAPNCDDILRNMTKGQWVKKIQMPRYQNQFEHLRNEEVKLEAEVRVNRVERGIQTAFWRKDLRCGYSNYGIQPENTTWPKVGSWCNSRGSKPCCSNDFNGTCMEPSNRSCNCAGCVDLRKYKYAEVSDWIVADNRCEWKKYSAAEMCDVIERSAFSDIHFVGDSFIRNMFRTFAMMITNDFDHGAVSGSTPPRVRGVCIKTQQFFRTECRNTLNDISKTLDPRKFCGGRGFVNFSATRQVYFNVKFRKQFLELVQSKINVPGSLIILGVGLHMQCKSRVVIEQYLGPAIDAITEYYGQPPSRIDALKLSGRWPQIVLCLPPTTGLLKPTSHLTFQNDSNCGQYSSEMKVYADKHDVRVLDFRALTQPVYSFDGTHYGLEVNKMKKLILLNHIASLVP